jgi:hypothetical protein
MEFQFIEFKKKYKISSLKDFSKCSLIVKRLIEISIFTTDSTNKMYNNSKSLFRDFCKDFYDKKGEIGYDFDRFDIEEFIVEINKQKYDLWSVEFVGPGSCGDHCEYYIQKDNIIIQFITIVESTHWGFNNENLQHFGMYLTDKLAKNITEILSDRKKNKIVSSTIPKDINKNKKLILTNAFKNSSSNTSDISETSDNTSDNTSNSANSIVLDNVSKDSDSSLDTTSDRTPDKVFNNVLDRTSEATSEAASYLNILNEDSEEFEKNYKLYKEEINNFKFVFQHPSYIYQPKY